MLKSRHVLKALTSLSQESRLAVFKLLVKAGPEGIPSGEIAKKLEIPPATLSFHMNHLSNAKLVSSRKVGRSIIYSANFERMKGVLEYLLDRCSDVSMIGADDESEPTAEA
jgi:DNA-binding transcriptional ArsR family regulator